MRKIVINRCFGGFGLSQEAIDLYKSLSAGKGIDERFCERDDPLLVSVVETLGTAASDSLANLKVVEIPDEVKWTIKDYDGNEWVAEVHHTWF